jgi:hypothetical protein
VGFDEAEEVRRRRRRADGAGSVADEDAADSEWEVEGGYPGEVGWHSAGCGRLIPIPSQGTCSHRYFPLWEWVWVAVCKTVGIAYVVRTQHLPRARSSGADKAIH